MISAAVSVCVEDLLAGTHDLSNPSEFFVTPAGQPREPAGRHTVMELQPRAQHGVEAQNLEKRLEADRQRGARQDETMTLVGMPIQSGLCVCPQGLCQGRSSEVFGGSLDLRPALSAKCLGDDPLVEETLPASAHTTHSAVAPSALVC